MSSRASEPSELGTEEEWSAWYEGLSAKERSEISDALAGAPTVGPNEGPQTTAYISKADVTGYGGGAGGGKTALIAMLALQHRRTVIFRADAKQMYGLVDDMVQFAGTDTGLNRQAGVFRLPDRQGHVIEWGGIGDPGAENAWRGRAHDLFCVDEATEVQEKKVRFLLTWNRTAERGQRVRALFTFNPPGGPDDLGGGSGRWVMSYFAPWLDERHPNPAMPGEIRYFYTDENGEEREADGPKPFAIELKGKEFVVEPRSRTFIQALVEHNPYLSGTNYEQQLLGLEEPYRSQMLLGDFRSGIMDSEWQILPTKWVDEAMERWDESGRRESMSALGVDVARGGRDSTVLAARHGWWWDKLERYPGKDTPDGHSVAGLIVARLRDGAQVNIDSIGIGASPYDILKNLNINVEGVKGSYGQSKVIGLPKLEFHENFYNMRSVLWWMLRKILDPKNGLNPSLPKDNKLRAELIAVRHRRVSGKLAAESKEELKKRIGYSPDDADALVYSLVNAFDTPGSERLSARKPVVDVAALYPGRSNKQVSGSSWMGM